MKTLLQKIRFFLCYRTPRTLIKRKSKIIIGRALQRLDKAEILGDNVPYAVLEHCSTHGAIK